MQAHSGKARLVLVALGAVALAVGVARSSGPQTAAASSHAEAPLISQDPRADNTDLYAFVSPDRPDTVTMVANYIPLEPPASGPNFPAFDDSVVYAVNVDNNGDGREDLSYEFRFTTETRNPNTFLYNTGPITSLDDSDWNRRQTYSVTLVKGKKSEVLASGLTTPPDNIGPRSTPSYASLATAAVHDVADGVKVFAGQREDPFFVDLGSIFDLAGLRPFNAFHAIPLLPESGRDAVARFNTHSIVLQVPTAQLVKIPSPTIGIYASASRHQVTILRKDGSKDGNGPMVQVSRLGEPLINEAVIPLGIKDLWNRTDPSDDAQFESFYTSPEVSRLENLLYGSVLMPINESNRQDLVAILLTGVPGLNFTGSTKADLLRLNTSIPPAAVPNRLGVLAGDFAGFPNGRRLGDDIVDIELRAFAEGYGPILHAALGLPDKTPNDVLGDGVDANERPYLSTFPYVGTPYQGYEVP